MPGGPDDLLSWERSATIYARALNDLARALIDSTKLASDDDVADSLAKLVALHYVTNAARAIEGADARRAADAAAKVRD